VGKKKMGCLTKMGMDARRKGERKAAKCLNSRKDRRSWGGRGWMGIGVQGRGTGGV